MKNEISINKIIADIKATKGNRAGCHGLYSSLESDGYITSICKWTRATSPERIDALVEHVEKQDAALIAWEKTMLEVCGEDGPASVASEIRNLRALRDTALKALRAQVEQLAAENVRLRETIEAVRCIADNSSGIAGWHLNGDIAEWPEILPEIDDIETPATDAYLAGIKADVLPANIAEIIDSGDLETICYESERSYAEDFRLALYNFRQIREGAK